LRPRRFLGLWAPVALYAAALFAASSRSEFPDIVALFWDKLLHAGAWAVLTALALRATHGGKGPLRAGPTLAAAAIALAYGLSDEYHQSFVTGRDAGLPDLLADAVGTAVAIAAAFGQQAWMRRNPGEAPSA
jgi:VanZ family protein